MPDNENSTPNREYVIRNIINQRPGRMIQLASLLHCQDTSPVRYSDDVTITTVESGLLFYISYHPGVTNAILAEQFGRTRGAISQIVKKLEASGFIVREPNPYDAKSSYLYVSLEGQKIIQTINDYDMHDEGSMLQLLLDHCSLNEIETFFRMVDIYSALLIQSMKASREEKQASEHT